jgi:hypothetical protein
MEEKEGRPIVVEDNYGARWCFRYRYPLRLPSWWRQVQLEGGLTTAEARCGPPCLACTLFRTWFSRCGGCIVLPRQLLRAAAEVRGVWWAWVQVLAQQQEQDVRAGALGRLPAGPPPAGRRRGPVLPLRAGPPGENGHRSRAPRQQQAQAVQQFVASRKGSMQTCLL